MPSSHGTGLTRQADPGQVRPRSAGRRRRRRYPWKTWAAPGAPPFHVRDDDVPRRHLSGVLRTWASRKGRQVRMLHQPDGLLFQFGPPFDTILDPATVQDVPPGSPACPTCGQALPEPPPEPEPRDETPPPASRRSNGHHGTPPPAAGPDTDEAAVLARLEIPT